MKRSLAWTAIGQLMLFVFQFGSQVVVSRILTPFEVGVAALGFSIADFVSAVQLFGLRNLLIREGELDREMIATTFTINIFMSVAASLVIAAIGIGGFFWFKQPAVTWVLLVVAINPLLGIFELVPNALLQRAMQFRLIAGVSVGRAAAMATVSVGCAYSGYSYMSIAYGSVAGATVSALLSVLIGWRFVSFGLSFARRREVTRFGLHMLAIGGVNNVALKSTDLIIGSMLGIRTLGLFSRASALYSVVWTNVHTVISRVLFSAMAAEKRTTGGIRVSYLRAVDLVTVCLWPAFSGLAVLAGPAVHLMYGEKWLEAAPVLAMFSLGAIGLTSITMTWEVFVVSERTSEQVKLETIRSVASMAATAIGCLFGTTAAAAGRVVDAAVSVVIYRRPLLRLTDTRFREILLIYRRNGLLALAANAPVLAVMGWFGWRADTSFAIILAAIALGVLLWAGGLLLVGHPLAKELSSVLAKRWNRWPMVGQA
jgi:O-antigen/teichoic acid export membrane protein